MSTPNTPPLLFTVATEGVPLLQVPPGTDSNNAVLDPTHRPVLPVIAAIGFTVTGFVATHRPPWEYVIVVVPPAIPYTLPALSTVAAAVLLLVQVPPVPSTSVIKDPSHTEDAPLIATGAALAVIVSVATHPPSV